jgi:hypothetical protein
MSAAPIYVNRQQRRTVADDRHALSDDVGDPARDQVVHEDRGDPVSALPGEYLLARPVAAQTDLHISPRVDEPLFDERVERRPVRQLHAEALVAGVGMSVEVDHTDRPVGGRSRADLRLDDRVVAAEHEWQCARGEHLADRLLDRAMRGDRIGRQYRRVAVVDDLEHPERVDPSLQMRTGNGARLSNRPRSQAGSRPLADELVHRRADDRDVEPGQLRRILGVRGPAERRQPRVVRLFVNVRPAAHRIDHATVSWSRMSDGSSASSRREKNER